MTTEKIIIIPSKFNTIITIFAVALIVGLFVVGYFLWKNLTAENEMLRNEIVEFKKVTETLVRSSNKWVTKDDLEVQTKNLLTREDFKALEKDLNSLDARLTAVGKTIGSISKKVAKLEASDSTGPVNSNVEVCQDGRLIDIHGYTKNPQIKNLEDIQKAPVGKVEFDASKNKPWSYEIFKRNHRLITAIGKRDSGQLTLYHKLEYSMSDVEKNKWYPINLESSEYMQVPKKNSMYWFNPILDLNFFGGGRVYGFANGLGRDSLVSIGVDLGLSLSSYGETKADSWFRLFRIGVGYGAERRTAHFSFAPFAFNVGKPLPLLTNLYITPQLGIDLAGGLTVNLGVGPQF